MNTLGWILFAGCNTVCLIIGWTVRDWLHKRAEYRAEQEHERIVFGAAPDDRDRESW